MYTVEVLEDGSPIDWTADLETLDEARECLRATVEEDRAMFADDGLPFRVRHTSLDRIEVDTIDAVLTYSISKI